MRPACSKLCSRNFSTTADFRKLQAQHLTSNVSYCTYLLTLFDLQKFSFLWSWNDHPEVFVSMRLASAVSNKQSIFKKQCSFLPAACFQFPSAHLITFYFRTLWSHHKHMNHELGLLRNAFFLRQNDTL